MILYLEGELGATVSHTLYTRSLLGPYAKSHRNMLLFPCRGLGSLDQPVSLFVHVLVEFFHTNKGTFFCIKSSLLNSREKETLYVQA